MSRSFDVKELARIAVVDERSGRELYKKMVARAEDAELKARFLWLAEQEAIHIRRFEELYKQLEAGPPAQYPDAALDYLEVVVARGGQMADSVDIGLVESDRELVALAIRFEREQLFLQRDMSEFIADEHKQVIEAIISEERGHLVTLSRELQRLRG
jgi:rubrerythrin